MILRIFIVIAGVLLAVLAIGLLLPKERMVTRTAHFPVTPEVLYGVVTDNTDWQYRTGIKNLVITDSLPGQEVWKEYTPKGDVIHFRTREKTPYTFYSFDMESRRFKGYWTGSFEPAGNGGTVFTATEYVEMKNPFVKTLAYLFFNLGKLMDQYQADLQAKVATLAPAAEGIVMKVGSRVYPAGSEHIELTVANHTPEEIFTGEYFTLYRRMEGAWELIPLELFFIDIAYILQPGDTRDFVIALPRDQYDFAPGAYRIGKPVNGEELFAEFELRDE